MKYFLICILFFVFVSSFGQNSSMVDSSATFKTFNNTISVNASVFLEKLFKSNLTPDLNSSFVNYTRNFKKFFLRIGVNGWNSSKTQNNIKVNEQTVSRNFYSSATVAAYLTKDLSKSFSVGYGLNLLGAYVDSSVTFITTVDEVKNYAISKHYGFAPGVLLKYKINNRISLFAEYTIPIKMIVSETGTKYSLFPGENTTDRKTSGFTILFYNPLNIYVSCSF